jgi:O-methyltransferase
MGDSMSRLNDDHGGEARRNLAYERLYNPREASVTVLDRFVLYSHAADVIGRDEPVTYLEFGVGQGVSLQAMTREFSHPDSLFAGFDSFVGLPEDWLMHKRGAFSSMGEVPRIEDPRVRFVKGWFQNTLHESLTWLGGHLTRRVLIHYDADLYYSTLFLLGSLWPHCPEYHFIMDDFPHDDIVALHDFSLAFPVDIQFLARVAGGSATFGKMSRTQFSP